MFLGKVWTEKMDERLKELLLEGLSSSQVGRILGVSRNACIDRARRQGIALNPAKGCHHKTQLTPPVPRVRREPYIPPVPAPEEPQSFAIDIEQIHDSQCRYPHGELPKPGITFCGHPIRPNSSYCIFHSDLCQNSPPVPRVEGDSRQKRAFG